MLVLMTEGQCYIYATPLRNFMHGAFILPSSNYFYSLDDLNCLIFLQLLVALEMMFYVKSRLC